jgi:CubicO group peptidase (beta-lactamase class C family)
VQRHIAAGSFSGAVALVARNGRVGYHEAFGLMDLEAKKPMVKDGIFEIMSMTKPVIGVATLMMMEEGKVRLQDPISKFIPEWKDMTVAVSVPAAAGGRGAAPAAGAGGRGGAPEPRYYTVPVDREVQIRDILTHTSGVVSGTNSNFANRAVAAGPKDALKDYIPRLGKVPLEFQPGTRWAYSAQAGFDVLSRVVEVASGMPIDRFVKTRIFDPLDMKDTTYILPSGNPRLVKLYSRTADGLRPAQYGNFVNGIYFSGGGGLFSTAADYAQFAMMLANGGELGGRRILSPRLVELMGSVFAPDTLPGRQKGESFGLSVRVVNDPVARNSFLSEGSFGWSGAYGTHFWVDRKEKLVAVVMTQTSNQEFLRDFENMVMQAVVGGGLSAAVGTN